VIRGSVFFGGYWVAAGVLGEAVADVGLAAGFEVVLDDDPVVTGAAAVAEVVVAAGVETAGCDTAGVVEV